MDDHYRCTVNGVTFDVFEKWNIHDLSEGLIGLGVPEDHVNSLADRKLCGEEPSGYFHARNSKTDKLVPSYMALIPTDKIIGVTHDESEEKTVFSFVLSGDFAPHRFIDCLKWLNGRTLFDIYEDYKNMIFDKDDLVYAEYYPDLDGYYITSGRHRAFTAILLGAPVIGGKVAPMEFSADEERWINSVNNFYDRFHAEITYSNNCFLGSRFKIFVPFGPTRIYFTGYDDFFLLPDRFHVLGHIQVKLAEDIANLKWLLHLPSAIRWAALKLPKYRDYLVPVGMITEGTSLRLPKGETFNLRTFSQNKAARIRKENSYPSMV